MTDLRQWPPRSGLTLIELLVVMFILGVLFSLGVFFYPAFTAKQKMTTATDRITGALLMAKQRAKRDGLPTGVRFVGNELVYVQQPDTPALGRVSGAVNNNITITVNLIATGADPLVQTGDYIELNGGGRLHQILGTAVAGSNTVLTVDYNFGNPGETYIGSSASLSNYRIYPRPRVLAGEEPVKLPNAVTVTAGVGSAEVVFAPSGAVILQTNQQGQVFLVVQDTEPANAGAPSFIVAVRLRTGLIGVYPVSSGSDPYIYARDGRSSGL